MNDRILDFIRASKKKSDLFDIWKVFSDVPLKTNKLQILILNAPCNGFGDIVFAIKFLQLLREWYNCDVKIATTNVKGFITLGEDPKNLFELKSVSKFVNCRRFDRLKFHVVVSEAVSGSDSKADKGDTIVPFPKSDLIFVAPLQGDFDPDMKDVKKILPYANKFNTFFLSEYNDDIKKKIDFHTGVGGKRYGLLFTDAKDIGSRLNTLKNPYYVIYIADSVPRVKQCMLGFIQMICAKNKNRSFEIVLPEWALSNLKLIVKALEDCESSGHSIIVKQKASSERKSKITKPDKTITNKSGKFNIYLRFDIFPLPVKEMLSLIQYSEKDILLTGDQSITDALSCCVNKNIFYQIAPWKENFGKNLAKELPNEWLSHKTTSCGTTKAVFYDSSYLAFKKRWDFRILARPKLDAIFSYTAVKKEKDEFGDWLKDYEKYVLDLGSIKDIKELIME
jgi:hypothetical protein